MIRPLRIAVLLTVMTTTLHAQDRAVIRIGPALGYRAVAADISAEVAPGQATVRRTSTLLPSYAAAVGFTYPLSPSLGLTADVETLWNSGTAQERRTVPIVVDQQRQDAVIRRDNRIDQTLVVPSLGVVLYPERRTPIALTAALAIPLEQSLSVSDVFESPSNGTFVSSGTASRVLQNAAFADGPAVTYVALSARASRVLMVSHSMAVAPYIRGRFAVTSALQNGSWFPWEVGVGIDLCLSSGTGVTAAPEDSPPPSPAPVIVHRFLLDTLTVVDAYDPQRTDTLWTRSETIRDSLVQGALADTMVVVTAAHVVRHLPGPPPFLAVILDVEIKDEVVDSIAALRVGVECLSDTTTTTRVSITLDEAVIWHETFAGQRFQRTVVLSRVVPALNDREHLTLKIQAITRDAMGQTLEAVPRTITLRRARTGRTLIREP